MESKHVSQRHVPVSANASPTKISEMGKKARERLAEERKKRKTIKVLTEPHPSGLERSQRSATATKKRRVRSSIEDTNQTQETFAVVTHGAKSELDLDAHPLTQPQSDVVRIHGAPESFITPDMIRKFFVGLEEDIDRIFTLPSHPYHLEEFDDVPPSERYSSKLKPEMYTFRLFVKFTSKAAAALAVERSGESLKFPTKTASSGATNAAGKGIVLLITPVPKAVVQCIVPKMAIDAVRGEPIHTSAEQIQACLPVMVIHLIWLMAASKLQLVHASADDTSDPATDDQTDSSMRIVADYVWKKSYPRTANPLVQVYNALWDSHQELEWSCSPLLTQSYGIEERNPAQRLVENASDWLLDEMEKVHLRILQEQCVDSRMEKVSQCMDYGDCMPTSSVRTSPTNNNQCIF